jgi:hypothetical protein
MSERYYTSAGQQLGPVTAAQLKQAAQSGLLTPADLVWKDGMPDWVAATKLKGIFDAGAPAHTPAHASAPLAAAPQANSHAPSADPTSYAQPIAPQQYAPQAPSQIGYYNPTAGLGARLAMNLKGFPTPTGPQDQWPLADVHLGQLAVAESHRKHIRALASLFQLFFGLGILGSILVAVALALGLALGRGRGNGLGETALFMNVAFSVAFTILYYFAARETRRCRMWPAILFAVIYGLAILFIFGVVMFTVSSAPGGPGSNAGAMGAGMFGALLICIIPFAFLWMCIKAITSIPRFLACPVWAQEALVTAKL